MAAWSRTRPKTCGRWTGASHMTPLHAPLAHCTHAFTRARELGATRRGEVQRPTGCWHNRPRRAFDRGAACGTCGTVRRDRLGYTRYSRSPTGRSWRIRWLESGADSVVAGARSGTWSGDGDKEAKPDVRFRICRWAADTASPPPTWPPLISGTSVSSNTLDPGQWRHISWHSPGRTEAESATLH